MTFQAVCLARSGTHRCHGLSWGFLRSWPLGYSAQTWDVNAPSRCNSRYRTISSKELPVGEAESVNTQEHSEQPQPAKWFSSTQMSLRTDIATTNLTPVALPSLLCEGMRRVNRE